MEQRVTETVEKGRMETKYVCLWQRWTPERSIWSSLGLDVCSQHNALARHDTKILTSLVFFAVRVVTVHMQQNVHRPMGSKRPSRPSFHVVSFSLQLHLFFLSQCGSWRRDLWGTSLWHQTLHFRFDDVNHLPSGKQRKEERDEDIHREPDRRKKKMDRGSTSLKRRAMRKIVRRDGGRAVRNRGDMNIWSRQMLACEVRDGAHWYSHTSSHEIERWERKNMAMPVYTYCMLISVLVTKHWATNKLTSNSRFLSRESCVFEDSIEGYNSFSCPSERVFWQQGKAIQIF